jgi:hypothetical protein
MGATVRTEHCGLMSAAFWRLPPPLGRRTGAQDCLTFWFHGASPRYVTCHNDGGRRNEPLKPGVQAVAMPEADDLERLLDAALEQTFPASDPIAVDVTPRETAPPILNN